MLFPYLFKVSFLLAILTVSYRWLIQYETFSKINRVLLLFNMAAAWSLPLIPLPDWGPVNVQTEFHQTIPKLAKAAPDIAREIGPRGTPNALDPISHSSEVDWVALFYLIYCLGATVMIVRLLYQLREIVIKLLSIPSKLFTKGVRLIQDPKTTSPFSFFCWIIYNPERHADVELQHILAHESEHVSQKHSIDLLFVELQKIMLWFNPFSWVHQKLVQENLEYLVDQSVLRDGFEKKQYQLSLLKVVMRTSELPLTNSFAQSLLKKRIKMMNRRPSKLWVLGKYTLLIVLLYMSSAFVAPYKRQILAIIPSAAIPLVTDIQNVTRAKSDNPNPRLSGTSREDRATYEHVKDLPSIGFRPKDSSMVSAKSKWVVEKGENLYWAISPMATLADIAGVQQAIEDFGGKLSIYKLQYDTQSQFIVSLSATAHYGRHTRATDLSSTGINEPMKGRGGILTKTSELIMDIDAIKGIDTLVNMVKNDYAKALSLQKTYKHEYIHGAMLEKFQQQCDGEIRLASFVIPNLSLRSSGSSQIRDYAGLLRPESNTLTIKEGSSNSNYYVNELVATRDQCNAIPFEDIYQLYYAKYKSGKEYWLVITK